MSVLQKRISSPDELVAEVRRWFGDAPPQGLVMLGFGADGELCGVAVNPQHPRCRGSRSGNLRASRPRWGRKRSSSSCSRAVGRRLRRPTKLVVFRDLSVRTRRAGLVLLDGFVYRGDRMWSLRGRAGALPMLDRSSWSDAALCAGVTEAAAAAERANAELIRRVGLWQAGRVGGGRFVVRGRVAHREHRDDTRHRGEAVHSGTAGARQRADLEGARRRRCHHCPRRGAGEPARRRERLYSEHEATLLTAAGALSPDDLVTVARRWRALADDQLAALDARGVLRAPLSPHVVDARRCPHRRLPRSCRRGDGHQRARRARAT